MKGHIRKRGKKWMIVLDAERGADGKRRQKWIAVDGTKKAAERELARINHETNTGTYILPRKKLTVAEYLEEWLEQARPNLEASTFRRYSGIIRNHLIPALGRIQLDKLRPIDIQNHYSAALQTGNRKRGLEGGGLSAKTVQYHHIVIHAALERAVKLQVLARNPADAVEKPRARQVEMMVLDKEQTRRLLEAARGKALYMPILLAVTTWMRRGEILALRWKDVDLEAGKLAVRRSISQTPAGAEPVFKEPKTSSSRRGIDLLPTVIRALVRHKGRQAEHKLALGPTYQDFDLVCARDDGTPMRPDTVSITFPRLVKKAGLPPIRFHDLRHTHATQFLEQGEHPKIVSERLGHSSVSITIDRYSHVIQGLQREAVLRLDARLGEALGE